MGYGWLLSQKNQQLAAVSPRWRGFSCKGLQMLSEALGEKFFLPPTFVPSPASFLRLRRISWMLRATLRAPTVDGCPESG